MKPLSLLLFAASLVLSSCAPMAWDRPGWRLVWHDEFNDDRLDGDSWAYDTGGGGWGNREWQTYTNHHGNVRLEGGMLVIEAREEPQFVTGRAYSSARIKTQGLRNWQYGRVEARMKLPHGQGIWPAFWMLGKDIDRRGWPGGGEIDIMEFIGRMPDRIHGTVHGPGYSDGASIGSHTSLPVGALRDEFHVFAIEWEENQIRWFVGDQQYLLLTPADVPGEWVFNRPFFILLNLAVGGDWPGYPNHTTVFPQYLLVDYVRVYERR